MATRAEVRKWTPARRLRNAVDEVMDRIDLEPLLTNIEMDAERFGADYEVPARLIIQKVKLRLAAHLADQVGDWSVMW